MTREEGAEARKRTKRQAKEEERASRVHALERAGVSLALLEELLRKLTTGLDASPCDHTHRLLEPLLRSANLDVESARDALIAEGAGCDCEAILNIDVSALRPPEAALPSPARSDTKRSSPKAVLPGVWRCGRYALPLPKSPWKVEAADEVFVARFGAKNSVVTPRLRMGALERADEAAWCRERWLADTVRSLNVAFPNEQTSELERQAAAEWDQYAFVLAGPSDSTHGPVATREYVARSKDRAHAHHWMFVGVAGDGLAIELSPLDGAREKGDLRELARVLATLVVA